MGLWNVYVCVRGFVCVCMLLYVKCELCFSVCIRRGAEGIGVGGWGGEGRLFGVVCCRQDLSMIFSFR